jgi:hypothetical protein
MKNNVIGVHQPSLVQYVLCYVIWIIVAVSTIWLLIQAQFNMMMPLRLSGIDYRMISVINDASLILMGIIALAVIIILEYYLRIGVEKGKFWPRVARAITTEAILLAIVYIAAPVLLKVLLVV